MLNEQQYQHLKRHRATHNDLHHVLHCSIALMIWFSSSLALNKQDQASFQLVHCFSDAGLGHLLYFEAFLQSQGLHIRAGAPRHFCFAGPDGHPPNAFFWVLHGSLRECHDRDAHLLHSLPSFHYDRHQNQKKRLRTAKVNQLHLCQLNSFPSFKGETTTFDWKTGSISSSWWFWPFSCSSWGQLRWSKQEKQKATTKIRAAVFTAGQFGLWSSQTWFTGLSSTFTDCESGSNNNSKGQSQRSNQLSWATKSHEALLNRNSVIQRLEDYQSDDFFLQKLSQTRFLTWYLFISIAFDSILLVIFSLAFVNANCDSFLFCFFKCNKTFYVGFHQPQSKLGFQRNRNQHWRDSFWSLLTTSLRFCLPLFSSLRFTISHFTAITMHRGWTQSSER